MKYLAKYISPNMAEIVGFPQTEERFEGLTSEGFVDFVPADIPVIEAGQKIELSYSLIDGKVQQVWSVVVDAVYYEKQIETLKQELAASDYKVIKCYEATLVSEMLPYDVVSLHDERQLIRERISEIEETVTNL